ncbi:MAG: hypothetical protein V7742_21280 [Halioglobus sp.]
MQTAFEIVTALGGILGLLTLIHCVILIHKNPQRFLSLTGSARTLTPYNLVLCIALVVFSYCGTQGLLDGIPNWIGGTDEDGIFRPIKNSVAAMIAFFSIGTLDFLADLARDKLDYKSLQLHTDELESIIESVPSLPYRIQLYENMIDEKGPENKYLYEHLLRLTKQLDEKIRKIKNAGTDDHN